MITRLDHPTLTIIQGRPHLVLSHMASDFMGHMTIVCYAVWTPFGPRRIMADFFA